MAPKELLLIIPELAVAFAALVVLFADRIAVARGRVTTVISTLGLVAALAANIMLIGKHTTAFGGMLAVDSFGTTAKTIILGSAILVVWLASDYLARGSRRYVAEYYSLVLLCVLGALLMVGSQDFISFFLALQLTSIPLYILAGFERLDARSNEAAVKFLFLGMIASVIMLYGMSFVYGLADTVQFDVLQKSLAAATTTRPAIAMAILFVLVGYAFKASAVPFHFWVPDTYEGAPTPTTTLLATVPKVAAIAALTRLFYVALAAPQLAWSHQILAFSAVLTMTVGNFMALTQTNIKRMLAYSSVTHIGYMLIAFAVGTRHAFWATTFYLVVYILANVGAFAVVLAVGRVDRRHLIEGFAGLSSRAPLLAFPMAIFMISMLGIPPTAGFWGKLELFSAAVAGGAAWLAVFGVVNSLISAVYYVNVLRQMFMIEPHEEAERIKTPALTVAVVLIALVGIAVVGLYPGPLLRWVMGLTAVSAPLR